MRCQVPVALVILGVAGIARADQVADVQDKPPPPNGDFWRDIVEPHADEVAQVLLKINQALDMANSLSQQDADADGAQHARLLDEARGMARYLRRLAPTNPDVLLVLGKIADDSGRSDEALEVLGAYLEIDPEGGEAAFRVGRIHLRMRHYETAIRYLRIAAASPVSYTTNAVVYLATALSATGRDDAALDLLAAAAGHGTMWGGEPQLPSFALAVAYDRDEQISEAFEMIDQLQTSMQGNYAGQIQSQLDGLQLVPAAEIHYYRGLLYESGGYLDEARTEWLLYAGAGDEARFRARALAHVAAIDTLAAHAILARKPGKPGKHGHATGTAVTPLTPPPPPPSWPTPRRAPRPRRP